MVRRYYALLLILGLAASPNFSRAQDLLIPQDPGFAIRPDGRNFSLTALDDTPVVSTSPLFLNETQNPGVGYGSGFVGTANGNAVRSLNGQNVSQFSVGFDYLRPYWSFRDFNLAVPPAYAAYFPALGDVGHTDNQYAFVPRVQYDYYLSSLGASISASGKFLSLSGNLQRNVALTNGGLAELIANSSLTIVSINPVEFSKRFEFDEIFGEKDRKNCIADSAVDLSIGTRYVSVDQNYSGTLETGFNGTNITTRYTRQFFRGAGLTTAANWLCPLTDDFVGFSNVRGSILIGDSRRDSALTITPAGVPGIANTIHEEKTALAPIGEVELGIEWGKDLGELLRHRETKQQLTIRASWIGQFWGGMGPLSAGSTQGFRTSDLFLTGVSIAVGFRH